MISKGLIHALLDYQKEKKENGTEEIFEAIMADNFPFNDPK